jgi:hypothetical protein
MSKGRLEAFSDGVIAIIITIMVLEMKVPPGADVLALRPLIPIFLSYVLSFMFVGIYWNNHHHLLQAVRNVNGRILWANLHLLFWLSLTPLCDQLDGPEPLRRLACGTLWCSATVCWFRLFHPHPRPHFSPRQGFRIGDRTWPRLQGQSVADVLCCGNSSLFCESVACLCIVRSGCGHVAHPRPSHREGAR